MSAFRTSQDPTTHDSEGILKGTNPQDKGKEEIGTNERFLQHCENEKTEKRTRVYPGKGTSCMYILMYGS